MFIRSLWTERKNEPFLRWILPPPRTFANFSIASTMSFVQFLKCIWLQFPGSVSANFREQVNNLFQHARLNLHSSETATRYEGANQLWVAIVYSLIRNINTGLPHLISKFFFIIAIRTFEEISGTNSHSLGKVQYIKMKHSRYKQVANSEVLTCTQSLWNHAVLQQEAHTVFIDGPRFTSSWHMTQIIVSEGLHHCVGTSWGRRCTTQNDLSRKVSIYQQNTDWIRS